MKFIKIIIYNFDFNFSNLLENDKISAIEYLENNTLIILFKNTLLLDDPFITNQINTMDIKYLPLKSIQEIKKNMKDIKKILAKGSYLHKTKINDTIVTGQLLITHTTKSVTIINEFTEKRANKYHKINIVIKYYIYNNNILSIRTTSIFNTKNKKTKSYVKNGTVFNVIFNDDDKIIKETFNGKTTLFNEYISKFDFNNIIETKLVKRNRLEKKIFFGNNEKEYYKSEILKI